MKPRSPRELIAQDPAVPTLPEIFIRLDDALNDPRSSLADLSEIIGSDAGLTGRLLRVANSAFYNFPSRIDSITRAMTLVGTKQLRDLVLATTVMRTFRQLPDNRVNMTAFWQHSIACGVAARVIASQLREPNVEHFYVAGILHDLGRLLHYLLLPEGASRALQQSRASGMLLHKVEQELFGFDHAASGRALLEFWGLPAGLCETVGFHHQPDSSACYPREAAILHLADFVVNGLAMGTSGSDLVPPLNPAAWDALQLPVHALEPMLRQIELHYGVAVDIFLDSSP